ncbi:MAG TPA: hypothetical protein VN656_08785 [Stellaceae bacterium]|jgi:hypothetical protein|nr:hypothetical protein [Stellaceae bacterium]
MDCDATCLVTGASRLFDLIGLLILVAIALYAMRSSTAVVFNRVFGTFTVRPIEAVAVSEIPRGAYSGSGIKERASMKTHHGA